ncbi:hypothetical protein [Phenylobacterium sp.]|uniref:hypothetical protein n=1 Tax=Phenylobacterium sp. TaxID=1871053 RepID=UPI002C4055DA|nr:hypothetical protein [Phenylobacterium sp.]HVI31242.1 hypothetical protein [Phenylobacterium sp.]
MTHPDSGAPERRGSTTAQLRDDIQSGRTGDKVAGFDPAASPLGTDDEAAGTPPSPETVHATRAEERAGRPSSATKNAATPQLQPDARLGGQKGLTLAAAAGVGAAALLGLLLIAAL